MSSQTTMGIIIIIITTIIIIHLLPLLTGTSSV
jgi:hypothetical protein